MTRFPVPSFRLVFLLMAAVLLPSTGHAAPPAEPNPSPLRVLFIGDSLTFVNNLPAIVRQLSHSNPQGHPLEYGMTAVGGASLQKLWEGGQAEAVLRGSHWDYVVLQEQTKRPITNPALMVMYARLFDAEIKHAGAQTIFYMTWTHEDEPQSQKIVTAAYNNIGTALHARVAPVGVAWQTWRKDHASVELYGPDGRHPDILGSYLAACVLYETIYRRPSLGLTGTVTIDADGPGAFTAVIPNFQAVALQRDADEAVLAANQSLTVKQGHG